MILNCFVLVSPINTFLCYTSHFVGLHHIIKGKKWSQLVDFLNQNIVIVYAFKKLKDSSTDSKDLKYLVTKDALITISQHSH